MGQLLVGDDDSKLYTAVKEVLSANSYSIQFEHDNSMAVENKTQTMCATRVSTKVVTKAELGARSSLRS